MITLLAALASILMSVAAQFCLKAGMGSASARHAMERDLSFAHSVGAILSEPMVLAGFCLYGASAVVWLMVLSRWDVSKAYPLVGLGFVLTLVVGHLLGEGVTILRAVGVILIATGVVLVGRS